MTSIYEGNINRYSMWSMTACLTSAGLNAAIIKITTNKVPERSLILAEIQKKASNIMGNKNNGKK